MASELSKTGLRMFLRPLDRFLEFHMAPIPFRKIRQNRDFYKIDQDSSNHKNRSKGRSDILRPVLES